MGDRGLLWVTREDIGTLPAFQVDAVDTTGAGDAFHGAYAACIAIGLDWLESLRYASAVAALSCTKIGARLGLPRRPELDSFLNTHDIEI
jgi:sulfofructose kinase